MTEAKGFSVRIFLPNGEPEGLRIVEKSNWTGQGLIFPRSLYSEARDREELTRTGVYVLWGQDESDQFPTAYVGEGDGLKYRFDQHQTNKDFWTHAIAFTSKDKNLNKAHVQYLEARLVERATEANLCNLDNKNVPQRPSLSEADIADAELYVNDMLLCLPVVGVSFFESSHSRDNGSMDLIVVGKNVTAQGYEVAGGFVVRSRSQAVREEVPSIHSYISDLRTELKSKGVLQDKGDIHQFTQDYIFKSPSTASSVILGRSSNGRTEWKDTKGRTLKEIQEATVGQT